MPHAICSILLKGGFDQRLAQKYDLLGVPLGFELTLFSIDVNFTTYWQPLVSGYKSNRFSWLENCVFNFCNSIFVNS